MKVDPDLNISWCEGLFNLLKGVCLFNPIISWNTILICIIWEMFVISYIEYKKKIICIF